MIFLAFSGGLDSTTLLALFLHQGRKVQPVFFHYGSKHNPFEFEAAKKICDHFGQDLIEINLVSTGVFGASGSALLAANKADIPTQGYDEPGSLDATVVPGRNLIMVSMLASLAESRALEISDRVWVALAAHSGDHNLYPDCRPAFLDALANTLSLGSEGRVQFLSPFAHNSKTDIVREALRLNVPLELTRSCYRAQGTACGVCGTCRERRKSFAEADAIDPVAYDT